MLRIAVILSAVFALVTLSFLVINTLSFGMRQVYSREKSSRLAGIMYAFGKGMMPWEKESAQKHILVYLAGVSYHVGIFAGFLYLASPVFTFALPQPVALVVRVVLFIGAACGLALLARRIAVPAMRKLSCPDDYAANSIVSLFLALAAVHSQLSQVTRLASASFGGIAAGHPGVHTGSIDVALLLAATVMFLYVPVGKIRHCFFFFYVRVLFGTFYGRRAALPGGRELA